ncbi:hypothetical protein EIP91_012024 [Steccherinum ochraceum]|uniref:Cytochrome c oxidase subunit 8, mitochondrial n=1 Tax=Steccherinum ochraceum TaxID=92696 RepID=A0A4R0RXI5_9APHY|nr:hypothetical protein EIP91_012024 [Steccherinum ochraceum]
MSFARASSSVMRSTLRSGRTQWSPRHVRFASGHATHDPLPFSFSNKKTFKYKYLAFLGTGFAIPFIAVGYQL